MDNENSVRSGMLQRLRYEAVRRTFSGEYRIRFYEALRFLLANQVPLKLALEQISEAYTNFGQRWHPFAELAQDCTDALSDNSEAHSLENTLARWVPAEEAALISAGMQSGNLPDALAQAVRLTTCRRRILSAVLKMSVYPVGLVVMVVLTVLVFNLSLIPELEKMSSPDTWEGGLSFLYELSVYADNHGLLTGGVMVATAAWMFWSLPRWTRPDGLRRVADVFVPWSVYRDIQGAVFLLNMASLLAAQVPLLNALNLLLRFASPWLAVRLEAIIDRVAEGDHFGLALRNSGCDFPSREAANFLSLLTRGDGAPDVIARYGERWLEQTLERVNVRANRIRLLMLLVLVGVLLLLVSAVTTISQMGGSDMNGAG
ncbi:pilus assembly protein PilR [Salmonella enterica subsp. enterica]|nr:pilus assembly protein PilR [Salmonella enterica subsp. enterica]